MKNWEKLRNFADWIAADPTPTNEKFGVMVAADLRLIADDYQSIVSGEEMVTYSAPAGGNVLDEFRWVDGLEWFESDHEPIRLRRQRWVCVEDQVGTFTPPGWDLCPECDDESYGVQTLVFIGPGWAGLAGGRCAPRCARRVEGDAMTPPATGRSVRPRRVPCGGRPWLNLVRTTAQP